MIDLYQATWIDQWNDGPLVATQNVDRHSVANQANTSSPWHSVFPNRACHDDIFGAASPTSSRELWRMHEAAAEYYEGFA